MTHRLPRATLPRTFALVSDLVLAWSAFACAGNDNSTPRAPTDSTVATPPRTVMVVPDTGDFNASVERTHTTAALDSAAILTAVRTNVESDSLVRIVFEFSGSQVPGYSLEYVDATPTACGSGRPIELAGDVFLTVDVRPARAHHAEGGAMNSTVADRIRPLGHKAVRQMTLRCDFEGVVSWVVGLDQHRTYRVTTLESPPRLVIDILTGDTRLGQR